MNVTNQEVLTIELTWGETEFTQAKVYGQLEKKVTARVLMSIDCCAVRSKKKTKFS